MRAVVAFHSTEFDLSWPDTPDPNNPPLGLDCAGFILDALTTNGVAFVPPQPIQDECGWQLYADWRGMSFSLFVHWATLKSLTGDWWVVQVSRRTDTLRALFSRPPEEGVAEFCKLLAPILESTSSVLDIRWLGREEFAREY
jgi:hypothetical protein